MPEWMDRIKAKRNRMYYILAIVSQAGRQAMAMT